MLDRTSCELHASLGRPVPLGAVRLPWPHRSDRPDPDVGEGHPNVLPTELGNRKKIEVMKSNEPMWSLCVSLKIESQHENPGSYQSESFISNLDANKPSCWATRSLGFLLGPYVWEPNCRNGGISFLGYYRNLRFFWRNQGIQSICNNTQQFSYQVTQSLPCYSLCFNMYHPQIEEIPGFPKTMAIFSRFISSWLCLGWTWAGSNILFGLDMNSHIYEAVLQATIR